MRFLISMRPSFTVQKLIVIYEKKRKKKRKGICCSEQQIPPTFILTLPQKSIVTLNWSPFSQVLIKAVPVTEGHSLSFYWPIDPEAKQYKAGASRYLGHLIGHEAQGSLFSLLKQKGGQDVWDGSLGFIYGCFYFSAVFSTICLELFLCLCHPQFLGIHSQELCRQCNLSDLEGHTYLDISFLHNICIYWHTQTLGLTYSYRPNTYSMHKHHNIVIKLQVPFIPQHTIYTLLIVQIRMYPPHLPSPYFSPCTPPLNPPLT